ncbi:hypothetical protein XENTR_v10011551 [Xenopus tropicalis]|nr:hypothetical protein XENTR_v10011551 [Xenopus tropicalis]
MQDRSVSLLPCVTLFQRPEPPVYQCILQFCFLLYGKKIFFGLTFPLRLTFLQFVSYMCITASPTVLQMQLSLHPSCNLLLCYVLLLPCVHLKGVVHL